MMEPHYYSSIHDISKLMREERIPPVAVVSACIERIKELNLRLNAFITVLEEQALEQARAAEDEITAGKWRGPVHGVPVGIKDFYDTAGIRTTAGSEHYQNRVPERDANGVRKLKEAGAIIIGKMNMHALGMGTTGLDSFFGAVHNPWNDAYIPGGSSAGSAAAVASGMCYATLDTDAIGSCRLPAACCGVVGFKGTFGLINPQGILEGEAPPHETIQWLNHPGITTRGAEDTALVLDVLSEPSGKAGKAGYYAGLTEGGKLRIGVGNNFKADEDVSGAFSQAVKTIRGLGHSMSSAAVPAASLEHGIANIEADRKAIAGQAFKDIDVLLLPTTTSGVPTVNDASGDAQALSAENTMFANYYGLPAISVPCGFDPKGLPLGLQIAGMPGAEAAVLRLAFEFQAASE
ncbi:MAG: amidase, partial [Anaerolineales bacterium]